MADGIYNAVVSNHSGNVEDRATPSPSERGHHSHHWHGQRKYGEKQGRTGNAVRLPKDNSAQLCNENNPVARCRHLVTVTKSKNAGRSHQIRHWMGD